ncbi:MAG: adenylate/guanylate cyclase domain-containing protein, partial [Halobacteriales archaeon]|nr:adenylate/guanylate cyclase domain-containing protein [Halobacteriales archaeon]
MAGMTMKVDHLEAWQTDHAAWVAARLEIRLQDKQFEMRHTMVFILEAGSWKIVQSHFSAPVPNLETAGVELTGTLSQLLESIGNDADSSLVAEQMSGTSTLLFTDIIDSTALSEEMGDVAWAHAIKDHLEVVRRVVEEEGGNVVKTLGDGGMYAFTSGSSALRAAVKIQQTVERSPDTRIRVRIGAHTGDVVQADGDYLGLTVNKAARVAAAADAGQILVSSTTAGLVGSEFEFGEPITVELKGLAGTHELRPLNWRLTRTKPRTG